MYAIVNPKNKSTEDLAQLLRTSPSGVYIVSPEYSKLAEHIDHKACVIYDREAPTTNCTYWHTTDNPRLLTNDLVGASSLIDEYHKKFSRTTEAATEGPTGGVRIPVIGINTDALPPEYNFTYDM